MSKIIMSEETENHDIERYSFRNLDMHSGPRPELRKTSPTEPARPVAGTVQAEEPSLSVPATNPTINVTPEETKETASRPAEAASVSSEELIKLREENLQMTESFLKKIDELSSSVVKMEMKLEKQQDEFSAQLEEERRVAYESGLKEGRMLQAQEDQSELERQRTHLRESLLKIDGIAKSFQSTSDTIEKELVETAVDIAKEVIITEIGDNSHTIALALSRKLIEDVKGAMKITLKAHPDDALFLKENLQDNASIEVIEERAVAKGGVIIISDAGNLNGTIHERYERLKRSILENR